MNTKRLFIRNIIISIVLAIGYLIIGFLFFNLIRTDEIGMTNSLAMYITDLVATDDSNIDTFIADYHQVQYVRVLIYDTNKEAPIKDSQYLYDIPLDFTLENYQQKYPRMEYDSTFEEDCSVVVLRIGETSWFLKYEKKASYTFVIAKQVLSIGFPIVVGLLIIMNIFLYLDFKSSLKPLKVQIKKIREMIPGKATFSDVNDLGYMMEELKNTREELEKKEQENDLNRQKIEFILDSFSQALIVVDSDYKIVLINQKALEVFAYPASLHVGDDFALLNAPEEIKESLTQCLNEKSLKILTLNIGSRILYCQFDPIEYSWVKTDGENSYGASLLIFDITQERADRKMKQEFIANASHEFKSPLTSILGYLQLIENGTITGEMVNPTIDKCISEAQRMNYIVSDMLTLSSLESNLDKPVISIDVSYALDELLSGLQGQLDEKQITVMKEYHPFNIEMNVSDFYELFTNLLTNSIKYNIPGGTISLTILPTERSISVKDTGIGIPAEEQNHIFERFYRIDKSRSRKNGGTGLGLAIVKQICSDYHVQLSLHSVVGEGTEFILKFPDKE